MKVLLITLFMVLSTSFTNVNPDDPIVYSVDTPFIFNDDTQGLIRVRITDSQIVVIPIIVNLDSLKKGYEHTIDSLRRKYKRF